MQRLHDASTVSTRVLETRRPHFDFGDRLGNRHFVRGDLLTSHLVAVLSTLIPEGERFVVDAVKRYRDDLTDPALRKQANAFVGQESMHQREHDRLNQTLRHSGYPTVLIERIGAPVFWLARRKPRSTQLALTAAIEHWTAVLAEQTLSQERDEQPDATDLDREVRAFIEWHLIEEVEHKSVAFDVMQALGTTEVDRIAALRTLHQLLAPLIGLSMLVSLATDRAAWNPANIVRSIRWIRSNATFGQSGFMEAIREWNRVGFHPDQRDHTELLDQARLATFGPGSIVEKRSRRAAS
jgi:predicted metal-dependent hydrolase